MKQKVQKGVSYKKKTKLNLEIMKTAQKELNLKIKQKTWKK